MLCVSLWPRDKLYSRHLNTCSTYCGATAAVTAFRKNTKALLLFSCVRLPVNASRIFWIYLDSNAAAVAHRSIALLLHCCFWLMSVNIRWEMLQTSQSCLYQEFLSLVPISTSSWKYLTLNHNFEPFRYCLILKYFNCYGEFSAAKWNCSEDFWLPKSWWPQSMCQSFQKIQYNL